MIMKVEDLITKEVDINIFNDYIDETIPTFVGPQGLTEAGRQRYKEVLNLDVEVDYMNHWAELKLDHLPEEEAARLFNKADEFFSGAAGYMEESKYLKYFKED